MELIYRPIVGKIYAQMERNKIIILLDVKANYLLYWEDKFRDLADQFFISARDGYFDCKDYVPKTLRSIIKKEKKIDRVVSIGCTYLMYTCAEATRSHGINTVVSLNPIMLDGTGMCGVCRVSIGDQTKFVCVDGPDFDGHQVNWDELMARQRMYLDEERTSLKNWQHRCGGR